MQQLQIEYFFPLTEQIPLDLDFTPSVEYENEKKRKLVNACTLTVGDGVWSTVNSNVMSVMQFRPEPNMVGYWEVSKDLHVWRKEKPNWLHQKMTKVFFGWKWKDK